LVFSVTGCFFGFLPGFRGVLHGFLSHSGYVISVLQVLQRVSFVLGLWVSPQEDPQVREQMRKKHPSPDKSMEWPDLPQDWIQLARDKIDLRKPLERVLNDADPKAGVGPRGLHIHYLQVLAKGSFSNAEAQNAFPLLASLGKLYLTLGLPAWVRLCLGGGLLTALNKAAPKKA
jgi:hypothetical protein